MEQTVINTFKAFLDDPEAMDMYISGRAGTGKTTDVSELVAYCIAADINTVVTAYTHKAVGILASKMPDGTVMSTLHSFLGKRPTINQHATKASQVDQNRKQAATKEAKVLFIDEYSMIGEKDYIDLVDSQSDTKLKIVWVGDPYQLPPVKDVAAIVPYGDYQVMLTEIKRQAADNPLGGALEQLVSFIEGQEVVPLIESENFIRDVNIIQEYISCGLDDKIILAYTNKRVQEINEAIQGYMEPKQGDILFSPTTQKTYEFVSKVDEPTCIIPSFGDPLMLGSKFKTLEYLIYKGTEFCELIDEEGDVTVVAYCFGHYTYKEHLQELKATAADANRQIEQKNKCKSAAAWAASNRSKPLAKKRASAWRDFLSFNDTALCLDFAHALTVHKSQGSTYDTVFIDTDDLYIAASFSFEQYLKLMYVALSRASNKVVTN